MKKLIFHRYTTGKKENIMPAIKYLNKQGKLTNYNELSDITVNNFDTDKKLYIEIKVYEYN